MKGLYRNLKLGLHTSTWAYTSFGPHGPHIISPTVLYKKSRPRCALRYLTIGRIVFQCAIYRLTTVTANDISRRVIVR